MKLSSFAAIVAAAGIAQVLAVPLLVVSQENTAVRVRFGHAVNPQVQTEGRKMRTGPCRAHRFKQKAVEVSNLLRQALGLPLIQAGGHDDGKIKILPFIGTPTIFVGGQEMEGLSNIPDDPSKPPHGRHGHHPHGHHPHGHRHGHHHGHRFGKGSFVNRINYSLMNLGRWEGRAVAFVLGCGIGVLLRMLFVLSVVMYRAVKGQHGDEQHEYSIIEEIVDTPKSAPPSYTYPVDEKVPIVFETVEAPSTTEESN